MSRNGSVSHRRLSAPASQRGVTLLEVMIAVLILGISLLGIAAMQATALRNSQSSLEQGQAVAYSYSIIDAMRANRMAALTGGYSTGGMRCAVDTATGQAADDLNTWIGSLKRSFSGAGAADDATTCGEVACNGPVCTITIQWDDQRASAAGGAADAVDGGQGSTSRQVSTVVRI